MRRLILFAAAVTAVVSAGAIAKAAPALCVATFQADVTIPVGDWLYRRPVETHETPLLAKGIVLDDGESRYVLCAVDWCTMRNAAHDAFRGKRAEAVDTAPDRVAVHCVHQHTAPSVDAGAQKLLDETEKPLKRIDPAFLDEVTDRLAEAARESLGRLEACDAVGVAQVKVDRVASIRRVPVEGGKVRTRWSSCKDPELRAMTEGPIDPMLKTVTLARGEKPLVRIHYYATHPQSFYGDGRTCYDVPGFARERLEEKEGVFQIYFTGCAGDVTMGKYNDGSREARTELTERLYKAMEASAGATEFVPVDRIAWRVVPVQLPVRNDAGFDVEKNKEILAAPERNESERGRAAGRVACATRMQEPILLTSLVVGPVRTVHLPGEPMIEFQHFAQKSRPDGFVAVAGYGLGDPGYLCTARSYEEGGYEPSASMCPPEGEKVLKTAIRELLEVESQTE